MSVEFVIPVTDGCRRITQYKPYERQADFIVSAIFAKGEVSSLKESNDFHEMIGKKGALFQNGLSSGEGYKLFIDRRIGSGESWRLPTALNHIFHASEYANLAKETDGDLVVWSTGSIDQTLIIDSDIAYEIELKLKQSKELIESFIKTEKQVIVLVPEHEKSALKSKVAQEIEAAGAQFFCVTGVFDALEIIAETLGASANVEDITQQTPQKSRTTGKVVPIMAIFALLAGGGALYATINSDMISSDKPGAQSPTDPDRPETSEQTPLPGFQMNALQGDEATSCIALITQSGVGIVQPLSQDEDDTYDVVIGPQICGLQLKNTSADLELSIKLPVELQANFISTQFPKQTAKLGPQETVNLHFSRTKPSGEHIISVSGAAERDIRIRFSEVN